MELESITLSVWFLIGAVLVFFMQSGFAMVECGFTRAKNAGNILMKNLVDFCLGTVVFIPVSYTHLDVYKRQPLWGVAGPGAAYPGQAAGAQPPGGPP